MASTTDPSTLICAFNSLADAQATVQELVDAGVPRGNISLAANTSQTGQSSASSLGGLLLGIGTVSLPGVGNLLAAGPLAASISASEDGTLAGAMKDTGVPASDASLYSDHLQSGGSIVTVLTNGGLEERIGEILNEHNPVDLSERSPQPRRSRIY